MKLLDLAKTFSTNVEYKAQHNAFFVFQNLGANVDVDYVEIEGRRTTPIDALLAPPAVTESNLFGPEDLEDLYLVVPPNHRFKFVSSASGKVVALGKIGLLGLGEGLPADLVSRFNNMHITYKKPITFTKTLAVNESIAANQEIVLGELKPTTIERYILDDIIGFYSTNTGTFEPGKLALRFYYDDIPLDILETGMGHLGIDTYNTPLPPTSTTNFEPFWLREHPIVVEPNHTLRITVINVSGATITPPTGSAITLEFKALAKYSIIG